MPSVAEELAALKRLNLAKQHSTRLQNAAGLSTPEQEDAKVTKTNKNRRQSTYQAEAKQVLNAGTNAVDQDLEFRSKQIAQKKEDQQKKQEASKNLQTFNEAKISSPRKVPPKTSTPDVEEKKIEHVDDTPKASSTPAPPPPKPVENDMESVPVMQDDDVPELEEQVPEVQQAPAAQEGYTPAAQPAKRLPNRAEKKAKKQMEKIGMKPVQGIARVTLKLGGNQGFYTIFQPDVYEKNGSYIVFGEAQQGAGMMEQRRQAQQAAQMLETPKPVEEDVQALEEQETEGAIDESGLDAKDIELVVGQAGCSRSKAVAALRANNGDLVNAIMSLTT